LTLKAWVITLLFLLLCGPDSLRAKRLQQALCGYRHLLITTMRVITLIAIWASLSIKIQNCTSSLVSRALNRRSSEKNIFNSAEDFYTSDVSYENDDLQSEFPQGLEADVPTLDISDFGLHIGYGDLTTLDKIHSALENMDHESVEESETKIDKKFSTALTNPVTGGELSGSRHRLIFGMNYPERTYPSVNQKKSTRIRYNQDMENLGENFGSQSLQRERNLSEDLFGYSNEDTSEDTGYLKRNVAVSGKVLQNTKDSLRKWLENANIDIFPVRVGSSMSDNNWRKSYDYQHTDNWSSYYETDVIKKMFDQEWFPGTLDMSLEIGHEEADVKFACVSDDLWSRFAAEGWAEYNNCEFTCDCEEQSRWKRFVLRAPGCGEGSRRIRRACRKVWGK